MNPSKIADSDSHMAQFPFTLSWSHYVFLTGIKKIEERRFYQIATSSLERSAIRTWVKC